MDHPVRGIQQTASFAIIKPTLQKLERHVKLIVDMLTVKQTYKNIQRKLSPVQRVSIAAVMIGAMLFGVVFSPLVRADQFDEQINSLNQQNAENQAQASVLRAQAQTYQEAIDKLQAQINAMVVQIAANEKKSEDLKQQIVEAEQELAKQRKTLGDSIRAMYLEGEISTLEMLASSKDLSDFVDKQQYREAVQNKIKSTVDQITLLKAQLKTQKDEVERLLAEQRTIESQLAVDRQKQSEMLAYTESQKTQYEQRIRDNNAQISTLRAQQAAAYRRYGNGSSSPTGSSIVYNNRTTGSWGDCGAYRYCNYGWDDYLSETLYRWGLEWTRECVHYAADQLEARGYYIPYGLFSGRGNAYQWSGTTAGVATSVSVPQRDDVVYMPIGPLGHVGIVEENYGNGWVRISQMNFPYGGWYSTMDLQITPNLEFLRFHR